MWDVIIMARNVRNDRTLLVCERIGERWYERNKIKEIGKLKAKQYQQHIIKPVQEHCKRENPVSDKQYIYAKQQHSYFFQPLNKTQVTGEKFGYELAFGWYRPHGNVIEIQALASSWIWDPVRYSFSICMA